MLTILAALFVVGVPHEFHAWHIAYISGRDLWVGGGDGTNRRLVVRNADTPCWSPDKRRIAFSRGRELWIVKPDGTGLQQLGTVPKGCDITHIAWGSQSMWESSYPSLPAAKGQSILLSAEERDPETGPGEHSHLYQAPCSPGRTGGPELVDWVEGGTGFEFSHYAYPAWNRSGNVFAYVVNGDIWLAARQKGDSQTRGGWDNWRCLAVAEYDAPTYSADREIHVARHISWSPNGHTFAYEFKRAGGSGCEQVWVADVPGNLAPYETRPAKKRLLADRALNPSFSPDGKWVLVTKLDGPQEWDGLAAVSLDGKRTVRLIKAGKQGRW